MYMIITRKSGGRWHLYGSRLFADKKDAISGQQVGITCYPDNVFHIVYIGDGDDWDAKAVGQSR